MVGTMKKNKPELPAERKEGQGSTFLKVCFYRHHHCCLILSKKKKECDTDVYSSQRCSCVIRK